MTGDFSRETFDPLRHFSAVLQQQGRVALDADWNELIAILDHRRRAETVDTIGRSVVPRETPDGFAISISGSGANKVLGIGRGRAYVAGLQAENHGVAPFKLDLAEALADGSGPVGVLADLIGSSPTPYDHQPHWPKPDPLPSGDGPHLVYLDVWERELTYLEAPSILEPALGGVDTTTRLQTVWQVRLLPDIGTGATCATPDGQIPGWDAVIASSDGRLTSRTVIPPQSPDPCLIPPQSGYRGLENQLYRIEVHQGGPLGTASFKWSRDNASVAVRVTEILAANEIEVERVGRDAVLRFNDGDWIEITDDQRELARLPGEMRRIVTVIDETRKITLDSPLPADLIPSGVDPDTLTARHMRIRRWDQNGLVFDANGNQLVDLDDPASGGVIPIPATGAIFVTLESGVQVAFTTATASGDLHPMDYWTFAARVATGDIETLQEVPPRGIHHHYCRLAVVTFPATVNDCRVFWPPAFGDGEGCGCSVCVTAESHNSGALTIQGAISQIAATGGTICLDNGTYQLGNTPVRIESMSSLRLVGQGLRTILSYTGDGAAIVIEDSVDVVTERFSVIVPPRTVINLGNGSLTFGGGPGFLARNCIELEIADCAVLQLPGNAATAGGAGIALEGYQLNVLLRDNILFTPAGIAGQPRPDQEGHAPYLLTLNLVLRDNALFCETAGIVLDGVSLHAGITSLDSNLIRVAKGRAIASLGATFDSFAVAISGNALYTGGDGIVAGIGNSRIADNDIQALGGRDTLGQAVGSGIVLAVGFDPDGIADAQVTGNRIIGLPGNGILIAASVRTLLAKSNLIQHTGTGGIVMEADASGGMIVIENNQLLDIAPTLNDDKTPLAAIRLLNTVQASAVNNAIRDFAPNATATPSRSGIEAFGCATVHVDGNTLVDIGPVTTMTALNSVGIRIGFGAETIRLSANDVRRSSVDPNPDGAASDWIAILIEERPDFSLVAVNSFALPVFVTQGSGLVSVGQGKVFLAALTNRQNVSIQGNHATSWGGRQPVVQAEMPQASCIFAGNNCALLLNGEAPAVIRLAAQYAAFTGNVARRPSEQDAVQLFCKQFTATGNLTFGNIRANGSALPAPWNALNVLAP